MSASEMLARRSRAQSRNYNKFLKNARELASRTASKAFSPHKAAVSNILHMPLTVTGTGFIDFAAFHLAHGWGWLVTGISLVVLEHIVADEEN